MSKISYVRHRFPPSVIQRAVWLYFRFPLSFRDVEEMLAERGIDVSYETIRQWILKFGPAMALSCLDGARLTRCVYEMFWPGGSGAVMSSAFERGAI